MYVPWDLFSICLGALEKQGKSIWKQEKIAGFGNRARAFGKQSNRCIWETEYVCTLICLHWVCACI
jgi:hypothetical protein